MTTTVNDQTAGRESSDLRLKARRILDHWWAGRCTDHEALAEILAVIVRAAVAERYTAPLTLPAAVLEVPEQGTRWQVLDAKDETTWHDLTEVVDCANPHCDVRAEWQGDGEPDCVVLVSTAYADGFAHWDVEDLVSVRIPAAVTQ